MMGPIPPIPMGMHLPFDRLAMNPERARKDGKKKKITLLTL